MILFCQIKQCGQKIYFNQNVKCFDFAWGFVVTNDISLKLVIFSSTKCICLNQLNFILSAYIEEFEITVASTYLAAMGR